jgi:diketogulonate reductase-like aldo/keto reductase
METRLMQDARTSDLRGLALPRIMYGTAWKEDRTKPLVLEAIAAGFRAFDTANQRKHYVEEDVGAAVRTAIAAGTVTREDLFLKQSLPISAAKITASHTTLIAISPRNCANLSPAPLSTSV